jgi:hypothetical protein
VFSDARSSRASVSSETVTIVVSRIDMITPTVTTMATTHTWPPSGSSVAVAASGAELATTAECASGPVRRPARGRLVWRLTKRALGDHDDGARRARSIVEETRE